MPKDFKTFEQPSLFATPNRADPANFSGYEPYVVEGQAAADRKARADSLEKTGISGQEAATKAGLTALESTVEAEARDHRNAA